MECFDKVKKMVDKVKMIEKHLDIVSQTHQKMRDLQGKIIERDEGEAPKGILLTVFLWSKAMSLQFIPWLWKNVKT